MSVLRSLDRVLAKAGLCSRSQAGERIRAGRVRVRGVVVRDPFARVDARDVTCDGEKVVAAPRRYLVLHKPRGYVTTRRDPQGRRTVYDLLPAAAEWLAPVGRLDIDSSGLLLLTNDSVFADRITSPATHVRKIYRVDVVPPPSDAALAQLRAGVVLDDGPTRPAQVRVLGGRGRAARLEIAITEGRNRQVRRMLRAVGSRVHKLVRTAIGPLELGDLARGGWRELSADEVAALARASRPPR